MATIRNVRTGREVKLDGRSLVGRSHVAAVKLTAKRASNEHATIVWDGLQWTLRDLTSRNGTRVNGSMLTGQSWRLTKGDEITFGDPEESWCWLDGNAPVARATGDDGTVIEAQNGLLLLPNDDAPKASVAVREGQWEVDLDGTPRCVADGESCAVDGVRFVLRLPTPDPASDLTRTCQGQGSAPARICFQVSSDEEHVVIEFATSLGAGSLSARSFNYMLLVLARARVEDKRLGCRDDDAGWLYSQDLARKLNTSVENLNVDVHRARRAVGELGVMDHPANIVERRRTTGQIRLGFSSITL
jgi:hypothetical protein